MNDFETIHATRPNVAPPSPDVVAAAKAAMWDAEPRRRTATRARRHKLMRIPIAIGALAAATLLTLIIITAAKSPRTVDPITPPPRTTPTTPVTSGQKGPSAPVSVEGVGGVVIGMSPEQVAATWDVDIHVLAEITPGCATGTFRSKGTSGAVMFHGGKLVAIFYDTGATTDRGITFGSTQRQITAAYGPLTRRNDAYVPGWNLFLGASASGVPGLRFDVDSRKIVTGIGYGDIGVRAIEGCA